MKTNVYVDGFNLYYRAVRGTPYKWLDLGALSRQLVPRQVINRIRYFTARVDGRDDPGGPQRQDTYLRALATVPGVTIHYGKFRTRKIRRPLAGDSAHFVEVFDTEEKRSDVNLATLLLVDCFNDDFEQALVITNDSDLALPIDIMARQFHRPVGVVNPNVDTRQQAPQELTKAASFVRRLRLRALETSQLPDPVIGPKGLIRKPPGW